VTIHQLNLVIDTTRFSSFIGRASCGGTFARVAWPSIGDFRASKHAGKGGLAGLDTALHSGASSAHSPGHVEHSALSVTALAKADTGAKVASRALRAGHDDIVFGRGGEGQEIGTSPIDAHF
jgi:hypothetical protein